MLRAMTTGPRAAAIVLAAGAGKRLAAGEPKGLLPIGGRTIVGVAAAAAAASPAIDVLVIAAPPGHEERVRDVASAAGKPTQVVTGGPTRHASVRAALRALPEGIEAVAVHDAARPFAPPDLFTEVIAALADGADGVVPVIPVTDTVKRSRDGVVVATEPRDELGLAQTPQAFRVAVLLEAHERAARAAVDFTDDAAAVEWAGYKVHVVAGDPMNFKITTLLDLAMAEARMGGGGGEDG
jgi:2-C-methyl-D-erythritol 4-phosphate cytidylyltransferase